jgi:NAD-dependent deacetylase
MKILIFTGAGVSKESGIDTFRDKGGLWEEFNVSDVATPEGWRKDPHKVMDFYNRRRNELLTKVPNEAHLLITELEKAHDVLLVTQNVDDFHERAGSENVIHLHGTLMELRSETDPYVTVPWTEETKYGKRGPDGSVLRPNVVWFGEDLSYDALEKVYRWALTADLCIIVGTSMQVEPASSIPFRTKSTCPIFYIDPGKIGFHIPTFRKPIFKHIKETATQGMLKFITDELPRLSESPEGI